MTRRLVLGAGVLLLAATGLLVALRRAERPRPVEARADLRDESVALAVPAQSVSALPAERAAASPAVARLGPVMAEVPPSPAREAPPPVGAKVAADLFSGAPPVERSVDFARFVEPDPARRARGEERTARAETLDRRLERAITSVRQRMDVAERAEREALARDLASLEKNLALRRNFERGPQGSLTRPMPASSSRAVTNAAGP